MKLFTPHASCSLSEWDNLEVRGIRLTAADRVVVRALADARRLEVSELQDSLRIETLGWIGVVRLDSVTIQVEPRLINGHQNLIGMLDYVNGLDLMKRLGQSALFETSRDDLFDLMALLLTLACDDVLRIGINADYVPQHDELKVLRGRLDIKAQMLCKWGRIDQLVCDYEERIRDVAENQWLLRALRLARRWARQSEVVSLVRRMASVWEEICDDDSETGLERPAITRVNHHYRQALSLAYLIVEGVTISNVLRSGPAAGFSFMLNMPRLFEEFVATMLERVLADFAVTVERQAADGSVLWDPDAHRPFGVVRPDVLLRNEKTGARLPIDAKYKNYGVDKVQPADIYQSAIYALALSRPGNSEQLRSCILMYPSSAAEGTGRIQVRTSDVARAEVIAMGVNVEEVLHSHRSRSQEFGSLPRLRSLLVPFVGPGHASSVAAY